MGVEGGLLRVNPPPVRGGSWEIKAPASPASSEDPQWNRALGAPWENLLLSTALAHRH